MNWKHTRDKRAKGSNPHLSVDPSSPLHSRKREAKAQRTRRQRITYKKKAHTVVIDCHAPLAWAPENAKPQRNLFSFPLMQLGLRKGKGPRVDATCMSLESFFYMQMGSWRQLNDPFSWRKPLSPMTSSVPTPNKDIWMITVHRSIVFVEFWRMVVHLKITN